MRLPASPSARGCLRAPRGVLLLRGFVGARRIARVAPGRLVGARRLHAPAPRAADAAHRAADPGARSAEDVPETLPGDAKRGFPRGDVGGVAWASSRVLALDAADPTWWRFPADRRRRIRRRRRLPLARRPLAPRPARARPARLVPPAPRPAAAPLRGADDGLHHRALQSAVSPIKRKHVAVHGDGGGPDADAHGPPEAGPVPGLPAPDPPERFAARRLGPGGPGARRASRRALRVRRVESQLRVPEPQGGGQRMLRRGDDARTGTRRGVRPGDGGELRGRAGDGEVPHRRGRPRELRRPLRVRRDGVAGDGRRAQRGGETALRDARAEGAPERPLPRGEPDRPAAQARVGARAREGLPERRVRRERRDRGRRGGRRGGAGRGSGGALGASTKRRPGPPRRFSGR